MPKIPELVMTLDASVNPKTYQLSKALIHRIVETNVANYFEISGINSFYYDELGKEHDEIDISHTLDSPDPTEVLNYWGPELTHFRKAIDLFCQQHEVLIIHSADDFILNLIDEIIKAQKTRKLEYVELREQITADGEALRCYPADEEFSLLELPDEDASTNYQFDLANPFQVVMPPSENYFESISQTQGPQIDYSMPVIVAPVAVKAAPTIARCLSLSTASTDSDSSVSAAQSSPSPLSSPREDHAKLLELETSKNQFQEALEICKKRLNIYNAKRQHVSYFFADILLNKKIPPRFYELKPIPGTDEAETYPIKIVSANDTVQQTNNSAFYFDPDVSSVRKTLHSQLVVKDNAATRFIDSKKALISAIKRYGFLHKSVYAEPLPRAVKKETNRILQIKPSHKPPKPC